MIAWIDLETTGLDTECSIIEVACVVTDDSGEAVDVSYDSIVGISDTPFPIIERGALDMHRKSGLWDLAKWEKKTVNQADRELSYLLESYAPIILGGQSVHFDRGFVERWMPLTNSCLSHRQIDVSGFKLLWSNALGIPSEALPPDKSKTTHRAMDDILASIDAYKWYLEQVHSLSMNTMTRLTLPC